MAQKMWQNRCAWLHHHTTLWQWWRGQCATSNLVSWWTDRRFCVRIACTRKWCLHAPVSEWPGLCLPEEFFHPCSWIPIVCLDQLLKPANQKTINNGFIQWARGLANASFSEGNFCRRNWVTNWHSWKDFVLPEAPSSFRHWQSVSSSVASSCRKANGIPIFVPFLKALANFCAAPLVVWKVEMDHAKHLWKCSNIGFNRVEHLNPSTGRTVLWLRAKRVSCSLESKATFRKTNATTFCGMQMECLTKIQSFCTIDSTNHHCFHKSLSNREADCFFTLWDCVFCLNRRTLCSAPWTLNKHHCGKHFFSSLCCDKVQKNGNWCIDSCHHLPTQCPMGQRSHITHFTVTKHCEFLFHEIMSSLRNTDDCSNRNKNLLCFQKSNSWMLSECCFCVSPFVFTWCHNLHVTLSFGFCSAKKCCFSLCWHLRMGLENAAWDSAKRSHQLQHCAFGFGNHIGYDIFSDWMVQTQISLLFDFQFMNIFFGWQGDHPDSTDQLPSLTWIFCSHIRPSPNPDGNEKLPTRSVQLTKIWATTTQMTGCVNSFRLLYAIKRPCLLLLLLKMDALQMRMTCVWGDSAKPCD